MKNSGHLKVLESRILEDTVLEKTLNFDLQSSENTFSDNFNAFSDNL